MADDKMVQTAINTIRTLAMDAVQQANSGHPRTPMAPAPVVYCLRQRVLRFGFTVENIVTAAKDQIAKVGVKYEASHHSRPL
jgi:transketolase